MLLLACNLIPPMLAAQTPPPVLPSVLPTLITTRAIHELPARQAIRHYPVHLQAVVTYYDLSLDSRNPVLFVCDASGCIYVNMPATPRPGTPRLNLKPGQLIELIGTSAPGEFAPTLAARSVRVVGLSRLPLAASRVNLTDLLSGDWDSQWVEIEGMVQSVTESGGNAFLRVALKDGSISALSTKQPGIDYEGLLDTKVRLRGNAASIFNRHGQLTGAHIMFPGPASVKILEPGSLDPFTTAPEPIDALLRYSPHAGMPHRVHIRGRVTLLWPGRKICLQDELQGICAQTGQISAGSPGDLVDVIGFPKIGAFAPTLENALYAPAGGNQALKPLSVNAAEVLTGDHDSQLVSIEGQLIGRDQAADDPTLVMTAGNSVFTALLPRQSLGWALPDVESGTWLRITGICAVQTDSEATAISSHTSVAKSFRILLRSPTDVAVIEKPTWWNAAHTLRVLAVALAVALLALCSAIVLSVRVRRQTAVIRAQLTETAALKDAAEAAHRAANYQATHDGLTGTLNRRAIFDALRREFELASRSGHKTGVIMLDLDHFKRVNDSCGHLAGDEILKQACDRILLAVRSTDLVGRYGGEEFLIVLPNCDRDQLQHCAERVRQAIAAKPIAADGFLLAMTTSAGATVAISPQDTEHDALRAADRALYQAKESGRDRVVFLAVQSSETAETPVPILETRPQHA
jgi:diguanylate cyclase (GGDEF)-like protein